MYFSGLNYNQKVNEPLLNKAKEIIRTRTIKGFFGTVKFTSEKDAVDSLIEFGKFYNHYKNEPIEEKIKEGSNVTIPTCAVCNKNFVKCSCF